MVYAKPALTLEMLVALAISSLTPGYGLDWVTRSLTRRDGTPHTLHEAQRPLLVLFVYASTISAAPSGVR